MEDLPADKPDPIGIPDAIMMRPTIVVVFDAGEGFDHRRDAVATRESVDAKVALTRATERLSSVVDALDRPLDKSLADYDEGPLDAPQVFEHDAGRI